MAEVMAKTASLNQAKIHKDGTEIPLTAYNINGNNYFKLRDIAQAFNIGDLGSATQTIGIDTTIDYGRVIPVYRNRRKVA